MIEKTAIPAYRLVPKLTKLITIASLTKDMHRRFIKKNYSQNSTPTIIKVIVEHEWQEIPSHIISK